MKKQYIHIKNYKFRNINLIKKYKIIGDFFISHKPTNSLKKSSVGITAEAEDAARKHFEFICEKKNRGYLSIKKLFRQFCLNAQC